MVMTSSRLPSESLAAIPYTKRQTAHPPVQIAMSVFLPAKLSMKVEPITATILTPITIADWVLTGIVLPVSAKIYAEYKIIALIPDNC